MTMPLNHPPLPPLLGLLMHILVKFYDNFKCPFRAHFSADFSLFSSANRQSIEIAVELRPHKKVAH